MPLPLQPLTQLEMALSLPYSPLLSLLLYVPMLDRLSIGGNANIPVWAVFSFQSQVEVGLVREGDHLQRIFVRNAVKKSASASLSTNEFIHIGCQMRRDTETYPLNCF